MLTTDANGYVIRAVNRVDVSLFEKARSAGTMRALNGGQMSKREQLYRLLRCNPIEVSQDVWEEYRSAYLTERDGVPF